MKYLFSVVVVVLGGLGVATVLGDPPSDSGSRQVGDSRGGLPETPNEGSRVGPQPSDTQAPVTSQEDFSERYKTPEDILTNGLEAIIKDLVTGHARKADRVDLQRRLTLVMEEEKLGDSFTRSETAKQTIDSMLKQMERFMPKEGLQKTSISPQQMQGIRAQAEQFSLDIRRKESRSGGRTQHEGTLMSAIDFDAPKGYMLLRWDLIGGFEYRDHMKLPEAVTRLHGKKVAIAGYMITLGEVEDIREFLLVESGWSCCFGVPPDVNQVIEVRIPKDKPGVEFTTTPIGVSGVLDVGEEVEDGFVISVYRIKADSVVDVE